MEKAYDIKDLGKKVKEEAMKEGLTFAEEAVEALAKAAYFGFKAWLVESAPLSDTKIDDFLLPFYDHIDKLVLPQIEKIDLDGDGK
jgi:hypothetical protein